MMMLPVALHGDALLRAAKAVGSIASGNERERATIAICGPIHDELQEYMSRHTGP
jgi:hypothetical protein